jgi:hypothetical protein
MKMNIKLWMLAQIGWNVNQVDGDFYIQWGLADEVCRVTNQHMEQMSVAEIVAEVMVDCRGMGFDEGVSSVVMAA